MVLINIVPHVLNALLYGWEINKNIKLDGIDRILASLLGKPDHVSILLAQIHEHAMAVSKMPPKKFHIEDGAGMVKAIYWIDKWYGVDLQYGFADIYNYEAEALGQKMIYGKDSMPTIDFREPLIKKPEDLDKIKTPIEPDWGRTPYLIDSLKENIRLAHLPIGAFCSQFSLAVGLCSYSRLMRILRTNPEFGHRLFEWIVDEVHLPYLKMLKKEVGAPIFIGADAWACFPDISFDMHEEWVVPYAMRLQRACAKEGILAFSGLASADYNEERVDKINPERMKEGWGRHIKAMLGMDIGLPFFGMGPHQYWPLDVVQEYAFKNSVPLFGKMPIIGGINARFMREGPVEKIVDLIKRQIDVMGREGRFVINYIQVPAPTPPEHLHAATHAVRTYGKYPIAKDLNKIEFKMPEFEPFEKWIKKQDTDYPWW